MADAYFLKSLLLSGFRAYLKPKAFDFSKKRCLAIFAPNGSGKSSVIDGLEFILSKDGTLERLGQRAINNQAGPAALAHNLADQESIPPSVTVTVISGTETTEGSRPATGSKRPIPTVATILNERLTVSPIIRGHALRTFVEVDTPEQRYADVANWLHLGPLVEVQKSLRALRTQIKAASEDNAAFQRIDTQLAKETSQNLKAWDAGTVLDYVNISVIAPLDPTIVMASLSASDPSYQELASRAKAEENRIGLAGLRQIRNAAVALHNETHTDDGKIITVGAIPAFYSAVLELSTAESVESQERSKAANAAFQEVWKAAEPLFSGEAIFLDTCPVCTTPISHTTAGSTEAIRAHLATHLEGLADYAAAKRAVDEAKSKATKAHAQLVAGLPSLIGLIGDRDAGLEVVLNKYRASIVSWPEAAVPDSDGVVKAITATIKKLEAAIADIESKQGDNTYLSAKGKIDRLLDLHAEQNVARLTRDEISKLSKALIAQTSIISTEIRKKLQALLDSLQKPMNDIYRKIQGTHAVPIRLELPAEDDTNQQRLNLLIDFAENRTGVQPGGYLSDSQIHSVALALRLAAIQQFNVGAPIMALDDIVTSYDADHRRSIAGLIATTFTDCQILITTHDERFFKYLKDQLDGNKWHFTQIIGIAPVSGPRFADHKVSDEMIDARWTEGQSAANEMRQAEEE